MRRPRVAYIVTDSVSTSLLKGQLRFLGNRGYEVVVISSPGDHLEAFSAEEGVQAIGLRMARPVRVWQDAKSLVALISTLRRLRPDIVNAGTPKAGLLGIIASFVTCVPVRVYMVRGLRLETVHGPLRWLLALMERIASFCSTHNLYISPSLRSVYEGMALAPRRKGVVLLDGSSRGVDIERFARTEQRAREGRMLRAELGIPSDARVAGFVGRLTRDKGIEDLVQAFLMLEEVHPDLHLLLVGRLEADDRPSVETLERIHGHPKIHMMGPLQAVGPAYQAMDFLVFPSYREGFGNVVLEAAAASRPTAGYRSTGVRDAVVDGKTGTLVNVKDVAALADAIARYAGDTELCEQHGKAAFERAKRSFAQEKVFEATAGFYADALGSHPDTAHLLASGQ